MVIPLKIPTRDQFMDEELVDFCLPNPDLNVERDQKNQIYVNRSPTNLLDSANNSKLNGEFFL